MSHAFFSAGYRPMFLGAAVWAVLTMLVWIFYWAGLIDIAPGGDPLGWHVHEMIFGYGGAVVCGFLLTAVPNWTNRPALAGGRLSALVLLWLAGRLALLAPPNVIAMAIDLSFMAVVFAFIAREILAAGNRRNLPVVAMVGLFWIANLLFHLDTLAGGPALTGIGTRMGIAVLILLICLIGGRITPAFTGNWLRMQGRAERPQDFNRADAAIMLGSAVALTLWTFAPGEIAGWSCVAIGLAHLWRMSRWCGLATFSEPLIVALHLSYLFVPVGFVLAGLSLITPEIPVQAGFHAWTVGAIGGMTLTVMTRATLGHSGLPLTAGWAETTFLAMLFVAAGSRIVSALGIWHTPLLHLSALLWMLGFALFALHYARAMVTPRAEG